jgi:hypothetical protein
VRRRTSAFGQPAQCRFASPEDWETTMIRDARLQTVSDPANEPMLPIEDRPLSFGAALVGFVLSTALTAAVLVLLSQ